MGDQVILPLPPQLDKIDKKILYELEQDSRKSLGQIAKKTRTSKQTLHYRIQRLVKEGVITGFITAIDSAKLGYRIYDVWIQLSDVSLKRRGELHDYLIAHKNVRWIAVCGGKYDLTISILAQNTPSFMSIFKEIARKFQGYFKDYIISTVYDYKKYPRSHFLQKERERIELFSFSSAEKAEVDEVDLKILSILGENSRTQILDLSKKAGVAPNTVRSRIKDMEKSGVIKGYTISINAKKAGYINRDMLISLQHMSEAKEKEVEQYCLDNNHIPYMMKVVGKWDMYLSFDSYSEEHYQEFLIEFRSRFANIIRDFELMRVMQDLKFDYFPMKE